MLFKLYNSLLSLLGNIFDQTKMQYVEVRALKSENLRYPFRFMYRYTSSNVYAKMDEHNLYSVHGYILVYWR